MTEWRLKCEAIEKRESERREVDAKKHREEVTFLENHGELAVLLLGGFKAGTAALPDRMAPASDACAGSVPAPDNVSL